MLTGLICWSWGVKQRTEGRWAGVCRCLYAEVGISRVGCTCGDPEMERAERGRNRFGRVVAESRRDQLPR